MKNYLILSFLIATSIVQAQWRGYFSYRQIKDLTTGTQKVFAASENTLFVHDVITGETSTLNTIDGLSSETISTVFFLQERNSLYIGYENGLLSIYNFTNQTVTNRFDIINKTGISINKRKINTFYLHNNQLYLGCDFGVTVFNPQTLQFGDTYFIGDQAAETEVLSITVLNDFIYALTRFNGIKRADLNNPFLIDFANWSTFDAGFFQKIVNHQNELVVLGYDGVFKRNGAFFQPVYIFPGEVPTDLRTNQEKLIAVAPNRTVLFNQNLQISQEILRSQISDVTSIFTKGIVLNTQCFIGTQENGLIKTSLPFNQNPEIILPDGPLQNFIFGLHVTPSGTIWTVFGEYSVDYNPFPLNERGISKFQNNQWKNIPFSELLGARSLGRIISNPNNENEVYATSFIDGVLKLENDVPTILYNASNSALPNDPGNQFVGNRVNGLAFDRNNQLWTNTSIVEPNVLHVFRNNQWQNFDASSVINNFSQSYGRIVVDRNNTKWVATQRAGVYGFNENSNPRFKLIRSQNNEQFPYNDIRALAIDKRNQLWMGTRGGLRILTSVDRFLSDAELFNTNIVIDDNGVGQELLNNQYITDIEVDGANNKWVATAESGVFLLSPNGQQTLQRFTKTNSPLPSDVVYEIEINQQTGEVFFATDKGLVSFQGTATAPLDDLQNVEVYPNPVRPGFDGTVKITGLTNRANIKITDISGSLVFETIAEGGTIEWDTTAFGKYKVASGVYMIFLSSQDGLETKVKKLMIVR
ncbi:MAG: two-component regulator propeller domain-containing protein [Flavobacterium sp.]